MTSSKASTNFQQLLVLLSKFKIRFIIIGGRAAAVHGLARATYDVDIVYARDKENLKNLAACLEQIGPYLRGAPPGLPFKLDEKTLHAGLNFTLSTNLGDLDLLGEVAGGGSYEELLPYSEEMDVFGLPCSI